MRSWKWIGAAAALLMGTAACSDATEDGATSEDQTLVIYSSRHYDSDYALYEAFTEETGIEVEVVEAEGDLLIQRIQADAETSPPDVIITVDAGRLWNADQAGLFAPTESDILTERVPATMRHPDGHWFGLSSRARVLVYAEDRVDGASLTGYESLADASLDGKVCARSSGNIYNISLLSALIDRWGEERAEDWAESVYGNFARDPEGGDSDQIKAVAAGECDVALVNHYYFARLARDEPDTVDGLAIAWPEADVGVHVNISGAGIAANARNPELAQRFLEFAVSEQAQKFFPELTNEYPAVVGLNYDNPVLTGLGTFKADPIALSALGDNQAAAQRIFDRVGWP